MDVSVAGLSRGHVSHRRAASHRGASHDMPSHGVSLIACLLWRVSHGRASL